jgi:hypothetical protein
MKQQTNQAFKPLNAAEVKTLCSQTKEITVSQNQLKKFSVVDLWSIQKSRRATSLRMGMAM